MGCKDIFVCLRDGRHFAELDSFFYKVKSEARLFSCYSGKPLNLCVCVIIDFMPGSEDLPAVLSCIV